jgi:hypothetical protein
MMAVGHVLCHECVVFEICTVGRISLSHLKLGGVEERTRVCAVVCWMSKWMLRRHRIMSEPPGCTSTCCPVFFQWCAVSFMSAPLNQHTALAPAAALMFAACSAQFAVLTWHACCCSCVPQAKEEEERRAAEAVALKASLAAGDKLEPAAAEQLMRYLLEEADGSAAKVRRGGCCGLATLYVTPPCLSCHHICTTSLLHA